MGMNEWENNNRNINRDSHQPQTRVRMDGLELKIRRCWYSNLSTINKRSLQSMRISSRDSASFSSLVVFLFGFVHWIVSSCCIQIQRKPNLAFFFQCKNLCYSATGPTFFVFFFRCFRLYFFLFYGGIELFFCSWGVKPGKNGLPFPVSVVVRGTGKTLHYR